MRHLFFSFCGQNLCCAAALQSTEIRPGWEHRSGLVLPAQTSPRWRAHPERETAEVLERQMVFLVALCETTVPELFQPLPYLTSCQRNWRRKTQGSPSPFPRALALSSHGPPNVVCPASSGRGVPACKGDDPRLGQANTLPGDCPSLPLVCSGACGAKEPFSKMVRDKHLPCCH